MKNRELFQRDPAVSKLLNDGVAAVREAATEKEIETLRYELEHFVCEGQYEDGLIRILESYLGNVSSTTQPAAWVSGFYGSGKSHLLKMFRHLWVDTHFPDGTTARGLARLPKEVQELLRELDTLGRRSGGLHAAAGTLPSGGGESVRLAVLSIVLASKGLPEALPQAQFCMWLQKNGIFDKVKAAVEAAGKDFLRANCMTCTSALSSRRQFSTPTATSPPTSSRPAQPCGRNFPWWMTSPPTSSSAWSARCFR